jgi:hypothetical protein
MYTIPFTAASSTRQNNHKNKRKPLFPIRLYEMLENAEKYGYDHIISWMADGRSFKIHTDDGLSHQSEENGVRRRGEEEIVNVLRRSGFNQKRYKSFLRQLQLYGFERIYNGKRRGICRHDFLVRGRPDLVQNKSIEDFQNKTVTNNGIDDEVNCDGSSSNSCSNPFVAVPELEQAPSELFLKNDNYNYWTPSFLSLIDNTVSDDDDTTINDDIFSTSSLAHATSCEG